VSNFLTDHPALYEARFPDPGQEHPRLVSAALDARLGTGSWSILDLGSGTGRDAGALAAAGHQVVGIDSSAAMVAHARAHHPRARFEEGDLRSVRLSRTFDAVCCMDSALLYCRTYQDLAACGEVLRHHLRPGGVLVAEMRNGAAYLGHDRGLGKPVDHEFVHDGVRYTSRTVLWIDHRDQLLRRRRIWFRPGHDPLVQESAWRLLFPDEARGWLASCGFTDIELSDEHGPALTGQRLHITATYAG
jgi:SAM-dependent methyltransferase